MKSLYIIINMEYIKIEERQQESPVRKINKKGKKREIINKKGMKSKRRVPCLPYLAVQ